MEGILPLKLLLVIWYPKYAESYLWVKKLPVGVSKCLPLMLGCPLVDKMYNNQTLWHYWDKDLWTVYKYVVDRNIMLNLSIKILNIHFI